jgi:hypothetical protein
MGRCWGSDLAVTIRGGAGSTTKEVVGRKRGGVLLFNTNRMERWKERRRRRRRERREKEGMGRNERRNEGMK